MKKEEQKQEKKELIEVKKSIINRIKTWIRRLFRRKTNKAKITVVDNVQEEKIQQPKKETEAEIIQQKQDEEIKMENEIIKKSKEAQERYVLMSEADIGEDVYKLIGERIEINKDSIEKLIEIRKEKISYERIREIYEEEIEEQEEYKKTIQMIRIGEKFLFSEYQVPKGVIGIITENIEEKIRNIFKAVTTRNGIIILEEKTDKHGIDKLIEIIVKEALKKYKIDENIIQIVEKEAIKVEEIKGMDQIIKAGEHVETKEKTEKLYIYEEDKYFEEEVRKEERNLKEAGKEVEIIRGKSLEEAISQINQTKNYAASIYSQDRKKGYKFINLIKSENVFFNGSLQNAEKIEKANNEYYTRKNILCESVLS